MYERSVCWSCESSAHVTFLQLNWCSSWFVLSVASASDQSGQQIWISGSFSLCLIQKKVDGSCKVTKTESDQFKWTVIFSVPSAGSQKNKKTHRSQVKKVFPFNCTSLYFIIKSWNLFFLVSNTMWDIDDVMRAVYFMWSILCLCILMCLKVFIVFVWSFFSLSLC